MIEKLGTVDGVNPTFDGIPWEPGKRCASASERISIRPVTFDEGNYLEQELDVDDAWKFVVLKVGSAEYCIDPEDLGRSLEIAKQARTNGWGGWRGEP